MKLTLAATLSALLGISGSAAPAARPAQEPAAGPRAKLKRVKTQTPDARPTLSGTVFDINGAVIPGARVRLAREGVKKAEVWATETDPDGVFRLPAPAPWTVQPLEPGPYTLTVESHGFQKFRQKGLKLEAGEAVTLDVTLSVEEPRGLKPADALR